MRTAAFVPIKFNSERLPGKNFLPLKGKPLCYHIFRTLLDAEHIEEVYVFCSNEKIMDSVPEGVRFLRRDERLDGNFIKGIEIYRDFVDLVDADLYVLAHATSPFLKSSSIDSALEKIVDMEYDSAFSVQKIKTFCWFDGKPLNYSLDNVIRTQDIEPIFVETSGFYIFDKDLIESNRRIGHHPWMQVVDDFESIDIDEEKDFILAKKITERS